MHEVHGKGSEVRDAFLVGTTAQSSPHSSFSVFLLYWGQNTRFWRNKLGMWPFSSSWPLGQPYSVFKGWPTSLMGPCGHLATTLDCKSRGQGFNSCLQKKKKRTTFRFFWANAHPDSLVPDSPSHAQHAPNCCTHQRSYVHLSLREGLVARGTKTHRWCITVAGCQKWCLQQLLTAAEEEETPPAH